MKALALDLGGSGGKIFAGTLGSKKIKIEEIHRFSNGPVHAAGGLYWDVLGIWRELLTGIARAKKFSSLGIDAFCNDYGLLDANGLLYSQVFMYRDERTHGMIEKIEKRIPPMKLYRATGCQRAPFNTLVQLAAHASGADAFQLKNASRLLFVPELLDYFLSGESIAEFTISSVSQCYNRSHENWDEHILQPLGIPLGVFQKVVPPATVIGKARGDILSQTGADAFRVTTVCHHDTASAVMAVPSREKHFAYISSGTWSLMGIETNEMITTPQAFSHNFANEGGFANTNRFLKNIMGLWILQECKRQFDAEGLGLSYAELDAQAQEATPFRSLVNPNDPVFFRPGNMVGKIQDKCRNSGQPAPESPGEINRCIKESLALAYRSTLEQIEETANVSIPHVNILGGGAQSVLLNRFAASAMNRPVYAGPFEAAAIGNLCAQFIAAGKLTGLDEARSVILESFEIQEFEPQDAAAWDEAYQKFRTLL
jgi:sugar (pentulose or hexulose) kinase